MLRRVCTGGTATVRNKHAGSSAWRAKLLSARTGTASTSGSVSASAADTRSGVAGARTARQAAGKPCTRRAARRAARPAAGEAAATGLIRQQLCIAVAATRRGRRRELELRQYKPGHVSIRRAFCDGAHLPPLGARHAGLRVRRAAEAAAAVRGRATAGTKRRFIHVIIILCCVLTRSGCVAACASCRAARASVARSRWAGASAARVSWRTHATLRARAAPAPTAAPTTFSSATHRPLLCVAATLRAPCVLACAVCCVLSMRMPRLIAR